MVLRLALLASRSSAARGSWPNPWQRLRASRQSGRSLFASKRTTCSRSRSDFLLRSPLERRLESQASVTTMPWSSATRTTRRYPA